MVYPAAPLLLVARRKTSCPYHAACGALCNRNMGVLPMAVKPKKIGAPADSPMRTFVIGRDKGSRNTAGNDDVADLAKVAIKRRMDDHSAAKEIKRLSKEVWDD